MAWLPPVAAAARLGIHRRSLTKRAAKDPKIKNAAGLYFVPDHLVPAAAPAPAPEATTLDDVKHDDAGGFGPAYYFDDVRDRYAFSLRTKAQAGRPLVLSGDTVRSMVQAYSRDGGDASINALARTFGLGRSSVREVMRALGKTHDSAPFTDEEIASRSEEDLGEDLIRSKEERVLRKAEATQWAETKRLAAEAGNLDRFVLRKLEGIVATMPPPAATGVVVLNAACAVPLPFTVVVGLTDFHFGAAGWAPEVGAENSREIQRARALATTKRLVDRVLRIGRPTRFLLPAGSDNFHADTDLGTTTAGTPLDTDGSFARMFIEGCALYEEIISILSAIAPVQIVAMPGNHDRLASMMLTHWLSARYRGNDAITVGSAVQSRSYHLFGKSLIGITHGDGLKDDKLPLIMASEAAREWGASTQRLILTGHLHTDRSNEFAGCRVIHMPCLATADRWHHRHGYVGNTKAIAAYCVDDDEGLIATLPVQPPAGL